MKSSGEAKLLIILGLIVLLGGGTLLGLNFLQNREINPPTQPTPPPFEMTAEKFDKLLGSSRHVKGDAKAPYTIVEFADFECPSCRRGYNNTLKTLLKNKPIRFAFRHYPLPQHQNAVPAALAMEAAAKQGKAWEMYAALFEGVEVELSGDYIQTQAKNLGLDMAKFDKDKTDPTLNALIEADKSTAHEYQVDMTPTFLIRDKDGKFHRIMGGDEFGKFVQKLFP